MFVLHVNYEALFLFSVGETWNGFGCLLPMYPEHFRRDSVYPSSMGGWNGWMARGLLHCLHLLYYSKLQTTFKFSTQLS